MTAGTIFYAEADEQMLSASLGARATFKYLWRELSWENRRIVPALEMYAAKVGFETGLDDGPGVEHMWLGHLNFDGKKLTGVLLNEPSWTSSFGPGDNIEFRFNQISDWMYVINGHVFGAYTVNLMRSRMSSTERRNHDEAWGLDFGDPYKIEVLYPARSRGKGVFKIFKNDVEQKQEDLMQLEHPMSLNMSSSFKESLQKSDKLLHYIDDKGNSMLHLEALAGNANIVGILLEHGAKRNCENNYGQKPLDLAKIFEWNSVIGLLSESN